MKKDISDYEKEGLTLPDLKVYYNAIAMEKHMVLA